MEPRHRSLQGWTPLYPTVHPKVPHIFSLSGIAVSHLAYVITKPSISDPKASWVTLTITAVVAVIIPVTVTTWVLVALVETYAVAIAKCVRITVGTVGLVARSVVVRRIVIRRVVVRGVASIVARTIWVSVTTIHGGTIHTSADAPVLQAAIITSIALSLGLASFEKQSGGRDNRGHE